MDKTTRLNSKWTLEKTEGEIKNGQSRETQSRETGNMW